MKLYLGFDGAYVLSKYPLKVFDSESGPFLATGRKNSLVDLQPLEAKCVFGGLKLKPYEVVEIQVRRKKMRAKRVTP